MRKSKFKSEFFFKTSLVMLFLLTITIGINKDLFAKFVSGDNATDDGRVAKFEITKEDSNFFNNFNMTYKQNGDSTSETKSISVTNNSEVAVEIYFTISSSGNLPLIFTITETTSDPDANLAMEEIPTDDGTKRGKSVAVTCPIGETKTFAVSFSFLTPDAQYSGLVDLVNITLTTQQID